MIVDGNINYKDIWEYDFDLDEWTLFNEFSGEGRRYMVSFVIGETAYAGTGTDGTNLRDFWAFDPLLSVDEEIEGKVVAYPNPSTNTISIKVPNQSFNLRLLDLTGRELLSENYDSEVILSKNQFGTGTYIYVLKYGNKTITNKIEFL